MSFTTALLLIAVIAAFLVYNHTGKISSKAAKAYLRNGAKVIDVRSAGEYTAHHLPNAMNLPLSEIETLILRKVRDKNSVLLLHCQSGMRSGLARKMVKALGYTNVYNLGSYGRAAKIVSRRR
jgi:rhodanese-related sulfurtransferase